MIRGISLSTATDDAGLLVAAAQSAEQAGFASVWCYDHLSGASLGGSANLDVWSILAAIAMRTEQVTIGSLVVNATTRHPAHIAAAAATMQSLTGGRFKLGLGAGASRPSRFAAELDMFGLPHYSAPSRRECVADVIAFLRALWDGEVSFESRWASFVGVSGVSIPQPRCPIILGANGPKMAALAARCADGVNFHSWEPKLDDLVRRARVLAGASHDAPFTVSVEGPLEPEWIDGNSSTLQHLAAIGVTEVMLRWSPKMGLNPIREAAQWLS